MRILSIDVPGKRIGGWVLWCSEENSLTAGSITFQQDRAESEDLRTLLGVVEESEPTLVILEKPFLYLIAENIGCIKGYCAISRIPWWQTNASSAKKKVLSNGRATKLDVLKWARDHPLMKPVAPLVTQHVADAFLYIEAWKVHHVQTPVSD